MNRRGFFATIAAALAAPAVVKAVPPVLAHKPFILAHEPFTDAELDEFSEMYIRPALEASAKAAANEWDRLAVEQQADREFALGDRWQA